MSGLSNLGARELLIDMFDAAVASAQTATTLARFLPSSAKGRLIVVGAGKASAAMARALELQWRGPLSGLVVTQYGYRVPCDLIEIVEASHPVPDAAGLEAARRTLKMVSGLSAADTVVCLISGGGSSLWPMPMDGMSLQEEQELGRTLLVSGATIAEINCVRRHLSGIKGGRLAARCYPAKVVTLLISDVPGDRPEDIASGPTVADPTTCEDALRVLDRHGVTVSPVVRASLESGAAESCKPGDRRLAGSETRIIAAPQLALEAAAEVARAAGFQAYILSDSVEGEAREVAKVIGAIAVQIAERNQPAAAPCVLLSGGETTVTVHGQGRGGRNVEFLLSLGLTLNEHPGIYAMAGDTDGVDGFEEIAGAVLMPDTLARARLKGLTPLASLDDNDGHSFFEALGDSVVTGPTFTNVNDFRAVLIQGARN